MGQSLSTLVLKDLVIQLSILARRYHGRCLGRVIVEFIQILNRTGASVCRCAGVETWLDVSVGV